MKQTDALASWDTVDNLGREHELDLETEHEVELVTKKTKESISQDAESAAGISVEVSTKEGKIIPRFIFRFVDNHSRFPDFSSSHTFLNSQQFCHEATTPFVPLAQFVSVELLNWVIGSMYRLSLEQQMSRFVRGSLSADLALRKSLGRDLALTTVEVGGHMEAARWTGPQGPVAQWSERWRNVLVLHQLTGWVRNGPGAEIQGVERERIMSSSLRSWEKHGGQAEDTRKTPGRHPEDTRKTPGRHPEDKRRTRGGQGRFEVWKIMFERCGTRGGNAGGRKEGNGEKEKQGGLMFRREDLRRVLGRGFETTGQDGKDGDGKSSDFWMWRFQMGRDGKDGDGKSSDFWMWRFQTGRDGKVRDGKSSDFWMWRFQTGQDGKDGDGKSSDFETSGLKMGY
ncbi:hypothetical protein C8J56DRAFT_901747 [Mycena floridula]|nr:hypothetical protein C8J56DRAFT_906041 [Mycena floridula]KAJ7574990.1 hypothetical protein C8J56DRAFT_901747 [Mycena floridula]